MIRAHWRAAGRRLAAIDPNRAGIGGLRFQLELAHVRCGRLGWIGTAAAAAARSRPPAAAAARRRTVRHAVASRQPSPVRGPPPDLAIDADRASASRIDTSRAAPAPPAAPRHFTRPDPRGAPRSHPTRPRPPAAPPASPSDRPARPAGDELQALLAAWPEIVTRLSAHPPTKPLIVSCRPVAVDGAIVTLGFPEEQAFLQGPGRAPQDRDRSGHRDGARSSGDRPLRRRQHRTADRPPSDDPGRRGSPDLRG